MRALLTAALVLWSAHASAQYISSTVQGGLSPSTVLPNGTTATTQPAGDNSTKVATTAYVDAEQRALFCSGSDGAVTISSGTTTLTRDMCYSSLTLNGTGVLATAEYRIFISGTLDISAAQAGSIINQAAVNGNNAVGAAGGAVSNPPTSHTLAATTAGTLGGAGTTITGGNGTAGTNVTFSNGGAGAVGGVGGAGGSAAGTAGSQGTIAVPLSLPQPTLSFVFPASATVPVPVAASTGSTGGGGGGGDAVNAGGGGGGGARGGGSIAIYALTIARGSNTNVGIISVVGGTGGAGAAGVAGTAGGGGGGGGASGGWVYIVCNALTGSVIPNAIDISGNTGGTGGNSPATNVGGTGGTGGAAGGAQMLVLSQTGATTGITNGGTLSASGFNATTFSTAGSAAVTATTTAGTIGGAGATLKVGL